MARRSGRSSRRSPVPGAAGASSLAARPSDAGALSNLGIALAASNRSDEAIAVFRRAVEADPGNTSARRNLVRALAIDSVNADAADDLRSVRPASASFPHRN